MSDHVDNLPPIMLYTDRYTQDNLGLVAHCNALLSGGEYRDVYQTAEGCVGTRYKSL